MISVKRSPLTIVALVVAAIVTAGTLTAFRTNPFEDEKMIILRGIAGENAPRGLLDDEAALAYAHEVGFSGEVLDVAADIPLQKSQVQMALERIRDDQNIKAIYGFSGGGYNAQAIWAQLNPDQRQRIKKIVVVGSPGVTPAAFPGSKEVVVQPDPPQGHMAGPKVLLEAVSR
jgi:hypothetical protein